MLGKENRYNRSNALLMFNCTKITNADNILIRIVHVSIRNSFFIFFFFNYLSTETNHLSRFTLTFQDVPYTMYNCFLILYIVFSPIIILTFLSNLVYYIKPLFSIKSCY